MNVIYLKFTGCVLLYSLWAFLTWLFHLDPAELVGSIKYALGALGLYHAIINLRGGQADTSTDPASSVLPPPTVPLR